MPNFFEKQRTDVLKISSQRAMAAKVGVSNQAIANWENESWLPSVPVAKLAKGYEVPESVMEDEVMAMRRRIESRKRKLATSSK